LNAPRADKPSARLVSRVELTVNLRREEGVVQPTGGNEPHRRFPRREMVGVSQISARTQTAWPASAFGAALPDPQSLLQLKHLQRHQIRLVQIDRFHVRREPPEPGVHQAPHFRARERFFGDLVAGCCDFIASERSSVCSSLRYSFFEVN